MARWRNRFSQLLNVNVVNEVRQTEIHIAEPLESESSAFEFETAIEKLKKTKKSPCINQIPAQLTTGGCRTIHHEIHKLINSVWN